MKNIITILLILGCIKMGNAQDASYSQFFQTPQFINPALTGSQRCATKVTAQYRNQAQAITRYSYNTMSISAEHRFEPNNDGAMFGLGMIIGNDIAGKTNYRVTQALLSASVHQPMGDHLMASIGFQGGLVQRNVDLNNMIFDRQFTGTYYDQNIHSGEDFTGTRIFHPDVSTGIVLSNVGSNPFYAGFSIFHINSPNISLIESVQAELARKYTAYLAGEVPLGSGNLNRNKAFVYHLVALFQGPFNEVNIGGGYRTETRLGENASFYLGGILKLNDIKSVNIRDAIVGVVNYESEGWGVGISIDFSTSEMAQANYGLSTFEFSFYKSFGNCREFVFCPGF